MEIWEYQTIIEPFRIKSVEPIPILASTTRQTALRKAGYNVFKLNADEVTIDLLTDSGTGAMSAGQWSALMLGDESYAGSASFRRFRQTVEKLTGCPFIFPVHQGRAAERILAHTVISPGSVILNNTHFDTTRANLEQVGATAIDLPIPEAQTPAAEHPFKGNMDLEKLKAAIAEYGDRITLVIMTLTNNAAGGQPVSMGNLECVSEICHAAGIPLFLDAARYAENAWFIHSREPRYDKWNLRDIARRMFDLADGFTMSAKKDAIVHIGGILACKNEKWADLFKNELILGEGFVTYGGLAGRDLEAMSVGLEEALDEDYLRYRTKSIAYFAEGIKKAGFPIVQPAGGHAVFIDAGAALPHLTNKELPGVALANAFYLEGGIRGVEIGSLMFDEAPLQLLRLAVPRRVYTQSHIDYVIEVARAVAAKKDAIPGYKIVKQPPFLRHFSADLAPIQ